MFCKRCQYPLAQLNATTCPECGHPFDPSNPRTFALRPSRRLGWRGRLLLLLVIYVGGYVMARGMGLMVRQASGMAADFSYHIVAGHHPGDSVFSAIRNAAANPVSLIYTPLRYAERALWNAGGSLR